MRTLPIRPLLLAATCLFAGTSHANLILNGGFEAPLQQPQQFVTIAPGNEPAGFEWQVESGNVDVGGPNQFILFPALEGQQGLDLNGTMRGSIFQDFTTVVGQRYQLRFLFADNPVESGVSSADVEVIDLLSNGAVLSALITHSTSSNSTGADANEYVGSFVATGTNSRLRFRSTSASNSPSGGVLLDGVSVVERNDTNVPAPMGIAFVGAMLTLLFGAHRKARG